jgi:beta-lactamase regulating signal transducer with metallopeptidase domain
MNTLDLFPIWLNVLALLTLEIALLALLVAGMRICRLSALWRRTLCQAGIVAMLVVTACELSGAARDLGALVTGISGNHRPTELRAGDPMSVGAPTLDAHFRSQVDAKVRAAQRTTLLPPSDRAASDSALRIPHSAFVRPQPRALAPTPGAPGLAPDSVRVLWLWLVWAVGAALVAARACFAHSALAWFRARRQPATDPRVLRRAERLANSLGLRRRVRVLESASLNAPIAFGLLRPAIGLPLNFGTQYNESKQEAMLVHELAHLAAHDPSWCLLADLATAILWWHPASWWLRRELQAASELAADEASLLVAGGPQALAECLVELGARLTNRPAVGRLRVSGFRSHLGQRVQRLVRLEGSAWTPPRRGGAQCVRIFGPIVLAAIVVLCTAWAAPQALTKGNGMKTMQQNWKRSLAALTLLAAISSPDTPAAAAEREQAAAQPSAPPAVSPAASGQVTAGAVAATTDQFRKRYGLSGGETSAVGATKSSLRPRQIQTKLQQIVLDQVNFDGLPLSEVVRSLSNECLKRDPEKQGVNFLINPQPPQPSAAPAGTPGQIDPTTGLPIAPALPQEQVDVNAIQIKFNLPLRNVTLKDTLDAIAMMADMAIQYTIEDYAVVFSLKPKPTALAAPSAMPPEPLLVRTYKVDTNTFFAGIENAFGIKREIPKESGTGTGRVQSALRDLLLQLGISMTSGKSIFYNDLTGVVMVRGTLEDQDIVGAAMQTLGGEPIGSYGNAGGGGGGVSPALAGPGGR